MTGESEQEQTEPTEARSPFSLFPPVKIKLPTLRPYDPRDLIEYTARQMRLRNWIVCLLLFYLTQ
jgi:hypothetical protein